jgi:hypothetical protein
MNDGGSRSARRLSRFISWLLFGLAALAFAAAIVLQGMGCGILFDPARAQPAVAYGYIMLPLNALAFALLGALINTFRPANRIGWLANVYGLTLSLAFLLGGYGECAYERRAPLAAGDTALWLSYALQPIAFASLALLPWLFPDGCFLTPRWRRVALLGAGVALALSTLRSIWPGQVRVDALGRNWIDNPAAIRVTSAPWLDSLIAGGPSMIVLSMLLAGIVSLILRWRRLRGETRQQMKWLTYQLATAGTLFVSFEIIGAAFFPAIFDGWLYLFVLLAFWLGLPVAVGLAVFKYRLYDIDIVIRKTLVYAVLSALLALLYFGSVILLQGVWRAFTGDAQSPVVIVASTLVIAALFSPLRRRVQAFVDRRFYRQKYNAQQVLTQFGVVARDETDVDRLTARLTSTVEAALKPERIAIWLPEGDRQ